MFFTIFVLLKLLLGIHTLYCRVQSIFLWNFCQHAFHPRIIAKEFNEKKIPLFIQIVSHMNFEQYKKNVKTSGNRINHPNGDLAPIK